MYLAVAKARRQRKYREKFPLVRSGTEPDDGVRLRQPLGAGDTKIFNLHAPYVRYTNRKALSPLEGKSYEVGMYGAPRNVMASLKYNF